MFWPKCSFVCEKIKYLRIAVVQSIENMMSTFEMSLPTTIVRYNWANGGELERKMP